MKNISIEFSGVKALNGVHFSMESGTIHALIGANGAGKSTLMKVLSGAYDHYSGEIRLGGQTVMIRTPKQAQDAGIQMVYQEVDTALIPYLTVAENIMLLDTIHNMGKKQWIKWGEIHERATEILRSMNINLSTKKLVSELTLAEKQMVLIARAISNQCKFLILDEPTAPLSHMETKELFRIVRDLKEKGVGIIFISHRLPEIFEICDEITIMRNGELVVKEKVPDTTPNQVVEHMLGQKLEEQFPARETVAGNTVLEVKGLSDSNKLKDLHIYVRAGEVVGIAGLVGAGKTELCKALFGAEKWSAGEVLLKGNKLKIKNPFDAVKKGIALVPEERRKEGILVNESVATNLTAAHLNEFTKGYGFLDRRKEKAVAKKWIHSLGIKTPSEETKVQNLSGGNQQKVAIGKWLVADADLYIFDEPTKGVDVGAKRDIFELIAQLARSGKAVLYASSELSEIMGITDRVYVLYDGKSVKELETKNTNEEELLYYSTGGR
ncbi:MULTISPECIES: sugar ABC transporter ATP-binding protein [Neobacillus]|uniref:Sugar ABC transporter ATP-binding protein n=1 Tax=Neobacillus sedimentimangrovi TaxID=2699460 RepID=A0ABS8QG74_9BACI|nr:sugar ABC transporter ATP-binding protein [Neobacillus sedimentimangrovi]AIM17112.1 ABC transporter [Bacillus sp. X1(2014)]MCD4838251.1 sugar ABC transporter ATP-binding protein [Neobacillus sedimentimangrovi]